VHQPQRAHLEHLEPAVRAADEAACPEHKPAPHSTRSLLSFPRPCLPLLRLLVLHNRWVNASGLRVSPWSWLKLRQLTTFAAGSAAPNMVHRAEGPSYLEIGAAASE
jgi:hypothetical protein